MTNLFIFNNLIVTIWNDRFESWTSHLEMLPVDLSTNLSLSLSLSLSHAC